MQAQRVWAGDELKITSHPMHPRYSGAIVKANGQFQVQGDPSPYPLHDADDVRLLPLPRHEINQASATGGGHEARLKDWSLAPIPARGLPIRSLRAILQRPLFVSPSRATKQAPESKRGAQNQSIDPWRLARAAVRVSPIRA
jgi:hypothetical protein